MLFSVFSVLSDEGAASFFSFSETKSSFLVSMFNRFIYKYAHRIVLRSKSSYECCIENLNARQKKKCVYIPLGRIWKDYIPSLHTKKFLFFGRLTQYKGLNYLLEICKRCPDIQFTIVGKPLSKKDANLLNELKKMPNTTTIYEYVNENDMVDYFKMADCLILPYDSATQSGVIVDSYSLSRPCIAFSVGGINEQIINGKTGFVVQKSTDLFVDAIRKFCSLTIDEIDKMSFNAFEFGKTQFSVASISSIFLSMLNELNKETKI